MWNNLIEFFTPQRGFAGVVTSFVVSIFPTIEQTTQSLLLFLFQSLAAIIGVLVGIATLYNMHMKWKEKRLAKKQKNETL